MSVAEKPLTEAPPISPQQQLAWRSFIGALFLLSCLGFIFSALPLLWSELLMVQTIVNPFLSEALLLLATAFIGAGLIFVGYRLDKKNQVPGLRSGIFLASVLLFLVFWFTCMIGNILERELGAGVAGFLTLALGLGLLYVIHRLFRRVGFYHFLVHLEEQGWFHALPYKPNQGLRVRRGTIVAVLTLGFCGIYTMISHNILGDDLLRENSWKIMLPFTEYSGWSEARIAKLEQDKKITLSQADKNILLEGYVDDDKIKDLENRLKVSFSPDQRQVLRGMHFFVPVLYKVHLLVPLLLGIFLIWLAWRIVNWPSFADFLIATEAEMNKVSWTTRKRLFQDTVVVLVTVVILTMFLFVVDLFWIQVLRTVSVLKVDVRAEQLKQQEKSQW